MTLAQDLLLALNYTPSLSSVIKSNKYYIEKLNKFKKIFYKFEYHSMYAYMFIYKEILENTEKGMKLILNITTQG